MAHTQPTATTSFYRGTVTRRPVPYLFLFVLLFFPVLWYARYFGVPHTSVISMGLIIGAALMTTLARYRLNRRLAELLFISGLALLLLAATHFLFVDKPGFSGVRLILTWATFASGLVSMWAVATRLYTTVDVYRITTPTLFVLSLFYISLMIGGLLLGDFRGGGGGGLRLSGGINPNTVGLVSLLGLFLCFIAAYIEDKWRTITLVTALFATITLFWSFSRASILAFAFFLLLLAAFHVVKKPTLIYRKLPKYALVTVTLSLPAVLVICHVLPTDAVWAYTTRRFDFAHIEGDGNVQSRFMAWKLLYKEFLQNPLFGTLGWYNASHFLSATAGDHASSPHGLYPRLLSEVGVLGTVLVLLLPIAAIIKGTNLAFRKFHRRGCDFVSERISRVAPVATSALLALFMVREIFEDTYLTSLAANTNTLFVIFLSLLVLTPTIGAGPSRRQISLNATR